MAYTAGDVLVRAVMTATSGLPADAVINDFAFQAAAAPTAADVDNMFAAVDGFYRSVTGGGQAVGQYISNQVNRGATHELQAFHIVAGPMGSPFRSDPWLGPPTVLSGPGLPTEVAGVLSFHADLTGAVEESGATRPRARRRGRVYIGPLITSAVNTGAAPYRLADAFTLAVREAAVRTMDLGNANAVPWCVWSRADATLRPVVGGWTDDAPDIQRRRGTSPLTRVVWG